MNVQVIMRDGSPEYAVLPWDEYQALLAAVGAPSSSATVSSPDMQRLSALTELSSLREGKGLSQDTLARSPTAHREAETAKAHRG